MFTTYIRSLISILIFLPLVSFANIEVVDDVGNTITLKAPAHRIVSLAGNLTEMLFAIGAGPYVVGVSRNSDYPPAVKTLPVVNQVLNISADKIVKLQPDLIVSFAGVGFSYRMEGFREVGIPVYTVDIKTIDDIPRTMRILGKLVGSDEVADRVAHQFTAQMHRLHSLYEAKPFVNVFIQIYAIQNNKMITALPDDPVGQLIQICGGRSIFLFSKGIAPVINRGQVFIRDPDVIMAASNNDDWQREWRQFRPLKAVANNNLFTLPAQLIRLPGPRFGQAGELVCQDLEIARQRMLSNKGR